MTGFPPSNPGAKLEIVIDYSLTDVVASVAFPRPPSLSSEPPAASQAFALLAEALRSSAPQDKFVRTDSPSKDSQ